MLELRDIDKPEIKDDEVLVRVHAASIHVGDWILMTGEPFVMRMATGLRTPEELASPEPTSRARSRPSARTSSAFDRVTRCSAGAPARSPSTPCAREDQFVLKPANLTFEQAAAVGVSATTALQLLRDDGKVKPGQKVLINGASGGVGTFAVQIAKAFGAEVTGVCSTRNVDLVRSIGADHVIDYTQEDFTDGWPALRPDPRQRGQPLDGPDPARPDADGTLISNGGGHAGGKLGRTVRAMLVSMFVRQQATPTVKTQNHDDLVALKALVEAGKVTPVIDRTYALPETPKAIDHVATGHARGTVVLTVAQPSFA